MRFQLLIHHPKKIAKKTNGLFMKRNISLFVLTFEIAAIVVLHAVKMSQSQAQGHDQNTNITKSKIAAPIAKHYPLLSIK